MNNDERRAYARGYSSGAKWPLHKPPLPPQPIAREVMLAAIAIRDAAATEAAMFGEDDEVAIRLNAAVDQFDTAVEALGRWLRDPTDGVDSALGVKRLPESADQQRNEGGA